ncbi:L-threonylcarbamoyladenylate synthase [Paenibacillus eucommiae]|uniref:Threonylcarbamoyl-AMP synthase n=1 Tax=Paenibacillus eucommiae TaxID=1355755 RepID=A0ABS4J0D5_9BACL|nr:L-threonylcarbamoyladenylate synthase [Paenibacillus eucommiae]MBP1992576.1 L-threonylcarbamoyladenylate synthase [Paenibacillus eucommiae]
MTKYWKLKPIRPDDGHQEIFQVQSSNEAIIEKAATLLKNGQTVAFPTETVYGLGADAGDTNAVKLIFEAKGRPSDNPLIVHIADTAQLKGIIRNEAITPDIQALMKAFWPGPLTIVLPVETGGISPLVTAGLPTVGVRIPDHPVALSLLRAVNRPIAGPSANRSGKPSPTLASHVREDLDGLIGGVLDGGQSGVGLESTVIQCQNNEIFILRPGGVTAEQMHQILPNAHIHQPQQEALPSFEAPISPGTKYTHYAPKGLMQLIVGNSHKQVVAWIQKDIDAAKKRGETTGVLTFEEYHTLYQADMVISCGKLSEPETIAKSLYSALRSFDEAKITYILAESCSKEGIGLAIMNRLSRASGHRIIHI